MTTMGSHTFKNFSIVCAVCFILLGACAPSSNRDSREALNSFGSLEALLAFDDQNLPARQAEVQEWVSTCMKQAGFDYIAWSPPSTVADSDTDTPSVDQYERDINQTPTPEDPNERIYDELPFDQQNLYFERLWGPETVDEGDTPSADVDKYGCYNAAWPSLYSTDSVEARWTLFDVSDEINQRIYAHSDYIAEEQVWIACMASNGFEISTARSLESFIQSRIAPAISPDSPDPITPTEDIDFEALRTIERNIRSANDNCSDNLGPTVTTLRETIETEIFAETPALLDQINIVVDENTSR